MRLLVPEILFSRSDRLQPSARGSRSEHPNNDENHDHGRSDEAEYTDGAVVGEKERDHEPAENGREPAPGINKTYRLRPDPGRVELRLVGMEGKRQPIASKRNQEPTNDQPHFTSLLREQQP